MGWFNKLIGKERNACIMCGETHRKGVHIHGRYFCSEDCFVDYTMKIPLEELIAREREDLGAGCYALLRK